MYKLNVSLICAALAGWILFGLSHLKENDNRQSLAVCVNTVESYMEVNEELSQANVSLNQTNKKMMAVNAKQGRALAIYEETIRSHIGNR